MKQHYIKTIFLCLSLLAGTTTAIADAVKIDGIYYNLVSKMKIAEVTSNPNVSQNGYSGSINIPDSVIYEDKIYHVTSIGDKAFRYCRGMTSVTIPNSVTSIGENAFNVCNSLTSVIIPNSVTSIGDNAFSSCAGLTSLVIGSGVVAMGSYAFRYNKKLASITILDGVKMIGDFAFTDCTISSIVIPGSVKSIGDGAFWKCKKLSSVTIEDGVTSISSSFQECSSLTSITIPSSVTSIDGSAFEGCTGLTSITIPNSVTSIGWGAFRGCRGLTSITIPDRVTSIGEKAFEGCSSLTTISIGSGVTRINKSAFKDCPELTDVYCYAEKAPQTESNAFEGSYIEYATLHVPDAAAYRTTSPWSSFGTVVSMPVDEALLAQYEKLLADAVAALADAKGTPTGLINNVSQLSSPYSDPYQGSLANLLDGNTSTFWHSTWRGGEVAGGLHYLQADLISPVETDVYTTFTRRQTSRDHVTNMSVYGTNNPDAEKSACEELLTFDCPFGSDTETITSPTFSNKGYRYLRFYANTTTSNRGYWHISEFQVYGVLSGSSEIDFSLMDEDDNLESVIQEQSGLSRFQISQDRYNELKAAYDAFLAKLKGDGIVDAKTSENATEVVRYDVQGQMIAKPQRGINIIRYSDGTTRKVMVK